MKFLTKQRKVVYAYELVAAITSICLAGKYQHSILHAVQISLVIFLALQFIFIISLLLVIFFKDMRHKKNVLVLPICPTCKNTGLISCKYLHFDGTDKEGEWCSGDIEYLECKSCGAKIHRRNIGNCELCSPEEWAQVVTELN